MYRPSPQVSKPSAAAAEICFKSSEYIIDISRKQINDGSVGITWVFLLVVNMSLNTLLWTTSYPEVRQFHAKQDAEELVNKALDVLDGCEERWPGTGTSSELYSIFAKACLQSYDNAGHQPRSVLTTPPAAPEHNFPGEANYSGLNDQQPPTFNPPQFGYVFDSPPESMNNYTMDPNFPPPQPSFRSNSIFQNPATTDTHGRRFSYFPPDFTHIDEITTAPDDATQSTAVTANSRLSSPPNQMAGQVASPPDSMANMSGGASNVTVSPPHMAPAQPHSQPQPQPHHHPAPMGMQSAGKMSSIQPLAAQRIPPYAMPHHQAPRPQQRGMPQQRPLPQQSPAAASSSSGDWFSPPSAFMSPYNFGSMGSAFYNDLSGLNTFGDFSGSNLGMQNIGPPAGGVAQHFDRPGRQGSLTSSQQLELMNVLETEGVGDIDAFLKAGTMPDARWYQ